MVFESSSNPNALGHDDVKPWCHNVDWARLELQKQVSSLILSRV